MAKNSLKLPLELPWRAIRANDLVNIPALLLAGYRSREGESTEEKGGGETLESSYRCHAIGKYHFFRHRLTLPDEYRWPCLFDNTSKGGKGGGGLEWGHCTAPVTSWNFERLFINLPRDNRKPECSNTRKSSLMHKRGKVIKEINERE